MSDSRSACLRIVIVFDEISSSWYRDRTISEGNRRQVSDHQYAPASLVTHYSQDMDDEIESTEIDSNIEASGDGPKLESPTGRYDDDAVAVEAGQREQQVVYMDDLFKKLVQD